MPKLFKHQVCMFNKWSFKYDIGIELQVHEHDPELVMVHAITK